MTVLVVLGAACGGAQERARSEAFAASREVRFTTADGVELSGRLFGPETAPAGIVFAHMLPADQGSWYEEAARYADAGYLALTFNFRGYCPGDEGGCSGGDKDPDEAAVDLAAAAAYLRSQGVQRIALVGASMGGAAALNVAASDPGATEAVITLSAPAAIGALAVGPDTLARIEAATLYLAATDDASAAQAAEAFYNWSVQPKRFEVLPSDDHGTDMLTGNAGGRVRDLMDLWLTTYLPVSAVGSAAR